MQVGLYILQPTYFINIGAVLSLRLSLATATLITVDRLVAVYHSQQNKGECDQIETRRREIRGEIRRVWGAVLGELYSRPGICSPIHHSYQPYMRGHMNTSHPRLTW